ncbi:hypothetical protein KQ298_07435 [Synechococcus sp. CS-1330]|nr:hypothetical protein [Synechococcus sp. CS-1330]
MSAQGCRCRFVIDQAVNVLQLLLLCSSLAILILVVFAVCRHFVMLVGTLFLEALITGIIDPAELNWLASHQSDFNRLEEATAL